eukprot:2599632-Heterocapsa_arctica.AAC.1
MAVVGGNARLARQFRAQSSPGTETARGQCPAGGKPRLQVLASSEGGHKFLVAACDGVPLVFCSSCGKWGTRKIN